MTGSNTRSRTSILFTGLAFMSACADSPDFDVIDSLVVNDSSSMDDTPSVDAVPEIAADDQPQFVCPPSPEPCVLPKPTCNIKSIDLVSLQHTSTCDCGADVNIVWSVNAPGGILEATGSLGAKNISTYFFLDESIPVKVRPTGGDMYEVSNSYLVSVDDPAYDNSTTWEAGLWLKTACLKNSVAQKKVNIPIKKNITSPCLRNDKIAHNPPNPASILGTGNLICWGSCEWEYTPPTHTRADIFDVTGGGKSFVSSELLGYFDVKFLPYLEIGKTYRVEYRNTVYSNGVQQCATNSPFVEVWEF